MNAARQHEEAWFLGLRMNAGVDVAALESEFGREMVEPAIETAERLARDGLLEFDGERVRLTARGRMISNDVFQEFLDRRRYRRNAEFRFRCKHIAVESVVSHRCARTTRMGPPEVCATTPVVRRRTLKRKKSPEKEQVAAGNRSTGSTRVRRPWPIRELSRPRAEPRPANGHGWPRCQSKRRVEWLRQPL